MSREVLEGFVGISGGLNGFSEAVQDALGEGGGSKVRPFNEFSALKGFREFK